jgi:glycosyltransferase involved in cell wall biosynthesis
MGEAGPVAPQSDSRPIQVSIGVPVYNGAAGVADALNSLVNQTLKEFEIIISDNASTDMTSDICRRFADREPRIRYYRQPTTISAADNFLFVLQKANAPYFMWAADDDLRAPDFIERLRDALEANRNAVLAFGDVIEMTSTGAQTPNLTLPEPGASRPRKLRMVAFSQLHHIYGLWRTEALRQLVWIDNDWWPDLPLMMGASMLGDFVRVPGAEFRYQTQNNRRYFALPPRPGFVGRWYNLRIRLGRAWHMVRTPFMAAITVGRVAGLFLGLYAGALAAAKAVYLAAGYFWHWLRVRLGVLPRPQA